jgi:Major tropism determinant N-terminal domain
MSVQVQHRRDSNTNIEAVTPAVAELGYDTTKSEPMIGDGVTAGGVRLAKKNIGEIVVAAQISGADVNDYNPTNVKHARKLIISTDAARNITGLVPSSPGNTTDGREITIYNGGSFNATLKDQSASSSANNRFDLGGADLVLSPKASVTLRYRTQGALNRWEMDANTAGAAVASASVLARTLASSGVPLRAGLINGTIVESHSGNAATFAIKTLAGNDPSASDPVLAVFQNGGGAYVVRSITAALSFTISSGSSMGVPGNGVAFRLWHLLIDTGSGVVLSTVNCLSGVNVMPLHEGLTYSSTAEGGAGAADNAQTIYSTAAQASKYICIAAYSDYDTGLAAAGSWASSPSRTILWEPGMPKPGEATGNSMISSTGAVATGTTIIPYDDTIPQNTEGDQYLSQAITPQAAANVLSVRALASVSHSATGHITGTLFRDSTANAIAANTVGNRTVGDQWEISLRARVLAVATTSTTFKVRAGGNNAGTATLNGEAGARELGGVANSYIEVEEIMG